MCLDYLDNIIVTGRTFSEHLDNLCCLSLLAGGPFKVEALKMLPSDERWSILATESLEMGLLLILRKSNLFFFGLASFIAGLPKTFVSL